MEIKETLMRPVAEAAVKLLDGITPFLVITSEDGLCSSVYIRGTLEDKEKWAYGIFHNAKYFQFHIWPMGEKRWYDPTDSKVQVELLGMGRGMPKFRKYTGPIDKVLEKIKTYIEECKEHIVIG